MPEESRELDGRVAIITGGASGIGAATGATLARAGATVVLADLDVDAAGRRADAISAAGGEALAVRTDVADFGSQEALVAEATERFGRLDVFFANAGLTVELGFLGDTPENWRRMFDILLLGAAYSARASLPALRESGGHFLVTSSLAGHVVVPGSVYSAAKHGVTALAETLRMEVDGAIRVTCVKPGLTRTGIFDRRGGQPQTGVSLDDALDPQDLADAVLFAVTRPPHVDVSELLVRPRMLAL